MLLQKASDIFINNKADEMKLTKNNQEVRFTLLLKT